MLLPCGIWLWASWNGQRCLFVFVKRGRLQVVGCAKHIVSMLTGDCRLHALVGDCVLALEAPSQVVTNACLGRMRCWRKRACAVMQVEFPDCYLLASFASLMSAPTTTKGTVQPTGKPKSNVWSLQGRPSPSACASEAPETRRCIDGSTTQLQQPRWLATSAAENTAD